jgi:2-oxoisovalerate dehydrogenase E1 component
VTAIDTVVAAARTFSVDELLELHRRMLVVRRFEERASALYRDGEVPGFVHLSSGQEASSVGSCWPLRRTDGIVSNHRGHGHCLAKGADLLGMFAELMGRRTGTCGGLGGSMHIADVGIGVYGANGIVGAGLPIACGVAAAFQQRGTDDVVVAFFGDGAINQGAFHEAVNLAAVWRLPVIFVCENNGYSEFSAFADQHPVPVISRAAAYGIEAVSIDGNDVELVASTMAALVEARRTPGAGPALLEAQTYRHHGHYEGDPERYRTLEEKETWTGRDPLLVSRRRLEAQGVAPAKLDALEADVAAEVEEAIELARLAPEATIEDAEAALLAPRADLDEADVPDGPADYKVMDAVKDALADAMTDDAGVWLAGIDVQAGNVFGVTRTLDDRFPGRVRDTPISETAIMGTGVGAAMAGTRPVVELMYLDFMGVCFDQLLNQAAKLRMMTGGAASVPMVVRTQTGAGRSSGAQHSQSLEAMLAHVPGLTVVMPSTPADTYGLLRSAIEDDNPVIVIDHRLLYGKKGPKPPSTHRVPLGKGVVRRPGADVTAVSWSRMVDVTLAAATTLADEGIDVEVIDLRTVAPIDLPLIEASVKKTGRLLIAHEAVLTGGLGGEIAGAVQDACFWHLDAPITRVAAPSLPAPYAPAAEREWLPDVDRVTEALRRLART